MINIKNYLENVEKKGSNFLLCDMFDWEDIQNRNLNLLDADEDSISDLAYQIMRYNRIDKDIPIEDRKPISLYINSNGGLLIDSMYLVNIIKASKTPIIGICEGRAYSAGGLILVACHKRYCYEHSTFLLHAGSNGFIGDSAKMIDTVEFDKRYEKKVRQHYLDNTSISEELYEQKYRHEWYFTSDEMLKHGLVDEIISEIMY